MGNDSYHSNPPPPVLRGNPKGGYFPVLVRGLGAKATGDRGGPGWPRTLRASWPRGKAHEKGTPFPFFVPPLNNLLSHE